VGPSDLAVSMGHNPGLDRTEPDVDEAIGKILATAKKHGRKVGIHCGTPEYLKAAYARGFDFATLASDVRMIGQAIGMNVNAVRG
ncbi:MAG: 2,4-dihydroxyhept-2-ene-1,7-dioic acid aldolase, partial [Candidatus Puniceispirillaceae bacterium]